VTAGEAVATILAVEEGEPISDGPTKTVRTVFEHELIDVTWTRYEPGERGPDPHVHHAHVDAFYVVEGDLVFGVGPEVEPVRAPAGTLVLVPPNVVHTFENAGPATARWLNFHAPSTGFIAHLRGDREGFDSFDPPADGGRPAADATVSTAAEAERLENRHRTLSILGEHELFSTLGFDVAAGFEIDAHTHDDQVDSFFLLDGELELTVASGTVRAGHGTWMSAPPGALHGFRNPGPGRARFLNVHGPDAGFVKWVRSLERPHASR
jgi:quercetin dioxygenase-like cupin family protein